MIDRALNELFATVLTTPHCGNKLLYQSVEVRLCPGNGLSLYTCRLHQKIHPFSQINTHQIYGNYLLHPLIYYFQLNQSSSGSF